MGNNYSMNFRIELFNTDVSMRKFLVRPLRAVLGRICSPGWNKVKVSENLDSMTAVVTVATVVSTSLQTDQTTNSKFHFNNCSRIVFRGAQLYRTVLLK